MERNTLLHNDKFSVLTSEVIHEMLYLLCVVNAVKGAGSAVARELVQTASQIVAVPNIRSEDVPG